jgi:hypothetical protein
MKLKLGYIKKALYVCSALVFLVSIHIASIYVFAVHRFSVAYDMHLSQKAQDEISAYIQSTHMYINEKPSKIAQLLQEAFPFISHVSCWYKPSFVHIEVEAHRPCLQLTHEQIQSHVITAQQVVTHNNYCVLADYFESYCYEGMPKLCIALDNQDNRLPADVFAYLTSIDPSLIKKSSIVWRHRHEIAFDLYQQPARLLCNYDNNITQSLLDSCDNIAQELINKPIYAKGFCADVRFEDRIIISKLKS